MAADALSRTLRRETMTLSQRRQDGSRWGMDISPSAWSRPVRSARRASLADLTDFDDVFEMYKADPQHFDRVWKGWNDLVGWIGIRRDGDRIRISATTRDERNAPGDRLVVLLDGEEAAAAAPKGLTEKGATYAVDLACPPPGTVWEIRVEDDDGQGLEGWITTGRFRLREPMRGPSQP